MFLTPASVLGFWIRGILSVVVISAGFWLVYQWYETLPSGIVISERIAKPVESGFQEVPEQNVRVQPLTPTERLATWRPGLDLATTMLVCGTILLLLSVAGRWLHPYQMFLGPNEDTVSLPVGESNFIDGRNGSKLHVKTYGSPSLPTIILTHGWVMNHREWVYLINELKDK